MLRHCYRLCRVKVKVHPTLLHTAKTRYRKFETNIPRKGTAQLQSQFLHSCFYRFAYSACRKISGPNVGIYRSHTDTLLWKIGTESLQFLYWGYINSNFFAVHINRFIVIPNTLSPIHRRSADYSPPYSDSFDKFLRQAAFVLASILPLYAVDSGVRQMKQCWLLNEVVKHFYNLTCCSTERLDQGHLHRKLEVPRLTTCLGRELNPGLRDGRRAL
jgi:hypothetical protein